MPKPKKLHLWFPGIFEFKGGIQVYSAFLLTALQESYPDWQYEVFLKHDRQSSPQPNTQFHLAGRFPPSVRTIAFAAQLLSSALWQRPDLIITSHANFAVLAQIIRRSSRQGRGAISNIPYWAVAHGVEVWNLRPALKTALQHADRILAVSRYTRDRLIQQGLDADRIALFPNTFEPSRFQIAPKPRSLLERYSLAPDQPVILTVARLADADRRKGYDQIIRALPQIRQHLPNVCYLLVGEGIDRPRIEHLISDLDLDRQVTLAGFIPDAELGDYYNLCDVFAMPSPNEGFGIVYLEALACGKPVLAGNQDGARDPLQDGKLGVLIDPHDVESIAQTLVQILQLTYPHPLLYQPTALRQSAIEAFGFDRFRQTLAALF